MKPFNLEEYLKNPSRKVVTRDGRSVKIHCAKYLGNHPVIAEVENSLYSTSFNAEGRYVDIDESPRDLFFAPEKHEGWVMYVSHNFINVDSYIIPKKKPDGVEDWMQ